MIEKPLNRAGSKPRFDLSHLMCRFGHVDMKPCLCVHRVHAGNRSKCFGGCHGPQRMERQPNAQPPPAILPRAQRLDQPEEFIGRMRKAPLRSLDRLADPAMGIEHREECQADPRRIGRGNQPVRHLGTAGVPFSAGQMMYIMEFAGRRHAELQHLEIDECRNGFIIFWCEPVDEAVHFLPPGPEIVFSTGRRDELGTAREGSLECMRMQIGKPRHAVAPELLEGCAARRCCGHGGNRTVVSHLQIARREPTGPLVEVLDFIDTGHVRLFRTTTRRRAHRPRSGPT